MGILIVFKLIGGHIELAAVNFSQAQISRANDKIAIGKAHGCRAIAATAALVEYQLSMLLTQLINNSLGSVGCGNAFKWYMAHL